MAEGGAIEARKRLIAAMGLAASGNPDGIKRIYELTSAKLFGICLRICGERDAAEDVLQDVYVRVWRRAATFDASRASPISWLAVIARNAALDWRRASRRHEALPDDNLAEIADDAPLSDALIEADEDRTRLLGCLDGLPDNHATAIRRTFLEGLTYQQLSESTDTPLGSIKSWINRGMRKLKECLGDG